MAVAVKKNRKCKEILESLCEEYLVEEENALSAIVERSQEVDGDNVQQLKGERVRRNVQC